MGKGYSDSVPQAITTRARLNAFTQEEKRRRQTAQINKDFYQNKLVQYVSLISTEATPVVTNWVRPVAKKRASMLYQTSPMRTFEGPSASITALELIYEAIDIDSTLLRVDRYSELTGVTLVHPFLDDQNQLHLLLYDGTSVSAVENEWDYNIPESISVVKAITRGNIDNHGKAQFETVIRHQIWTDDIVVTYEGDKLIKSETNDAGFIPFSVFRGEETDTYLAESPITQVRLLNGSINQMLTDLGYTIKMQAASPIALEGYQSGEAVTIHPGRAFSLPVGARAEVLNFNPSIIESLEVIKYLEDKVFETSSVPKVSVVGGEGESGRELLVRWFPLTQVFKEKAVRFQKYELDLANMILAVMGYEPIESVLVDYPDDANLPLTPEMDTLEQDMDLGLTTPVLELMRRNSDLSYEEAEAQVMDNIKFNGRLDISVKKNDNNDKEV